MKHLLSRFVAVGALLALALTVVACSTESMTMSAFGQSRSWRPETTAYYRQAANALDTHLRSKGFSATSAATSRVASVGPVYAAQSDTWYRGRHDGSADLYVIVRQPTKDASGLHVMIYWELRGLSSTLDEQRSKSKACAESLRAWWSSYQAKHGEAP